MGACDLRINLGGMEMKNPVMPASGAYDYFEHNADVFPMDRLGAVMVKSVHRHPREGNSAPRITEVLGGMINAVGIPSVGIEAFMAQELPRFDAIGAPVVLSLSGHAPEHYYESAEIVADDQRVGAIELNLSCPNVGTGLPFSATWLDFMDSISEGVAMPLGALLMSVWIGWFVGPKLIRDEVDLEGHKMSGSLYGFFNFCIKFIVPVAMAFILYGMVADFMIIPKP